MGSGSSLDLHQFGSGTSLLDHHHGCYLLILLVIGSSIEPTFFHAGCRPSLHVDLFQHLYLTLSKNGPPNTYIWSCRNQSYNHIRKARPALTSYHVGTHPTTLSERPNTHIWQPMLERLSTYIWPCEEPILHAERALHLHLIIIGTNPTIASEWICTYI